MNSLCMSVLSNKAILFCTASLALLAGCTEKPSEEMVVQFPVSASAEVGLTKVSVQGDYSLVWNQDDRVAFLAVGPGGASAGSDVDAVLREAVAALTGGRGHIVKVTKL